MRALTFGGVETVLYDTVPEPAIADEGDALVEVEVAGICGSDLHPYFGRETGLDTGTVLGHEFVGRVVETGAAVRRLRPGARVVSPFTTSCGACFFCRSGLTARCEQGRLFGWVEGGRGLHGGQAERVRVPLADATLVEVPEEVPSELALLAGDVLSTGLFGAEMARAAPGAVAAIVGCGPVGLMAVVGCRQLGAERVLAVDRVAERLRAAERLGAEPIDAGPPDAESKAPDAADPEVTAAVRETTGGRGADAAVEAVGSPAALRLAVELVRPGGTVAAVGVHTAPTLPFSPVEAYDRNLTFRTGRCPARHYLPMALDLLRTGSPDLAPLITHRLPLADGPAAYRLFAERRDGCLKVILLP